MADEKELARQLAAAAERERAATSRLMSGLQPDEWEEWEDARADMLRLERELASTRGEEYAEPLDFPVRWDIGAPLPHYFDSGLRKFLTFYVREPDPDWDGTYVHVKNPADQSEELLALVEFTGCHSAKMGNPNDEVHLGHPLYGRGMEGYTAQVVRNSRWLRELEAINSVHDYYNPASWKDLNHYVFWFHDETFECVARGFKVEVHRESMPALMHRVIHRMLEDP